MLDHATGAPDASNGTDDTADTDSALAEESTPGARRRIPLALVVTAASLLVFAGVVVALAMAGVFDSDQPTPSAEERLITAYERSRGAVFAATGTFSRTLSDGRRLESGSLVVQRPPDELRRQLGGMSGRINGRLVNCTTGLDGRFQCAEGAEVGSWDAMVTKEVDNLRSYFDPQRRAYEAQALPGDCFELTSTGVVADPPYGVRAVMCFDPPTGAMRTIEVEHPNGAVDRLEAASVRATITPEDFSLDDDPAFASRAGDGED